MPFAMSAAALLASGCEREQQDRAADSHQGGEAPIAANQLRNGSQRPDGLPVDPRAKIAQELPLPELESVELQLGRSEFEAAGQKLEAILDAHPDHAYASLLMGVSQHEQKRYARALPHFEAAVRKGNAYPKYTAAIYFMAWCSLQLGQLERARELFQTHLEFEPDEGDSYFGLGLIAIELGLHGEAQTQLERAIARFKDKAARLGTGQEADLAKCHARLSDVALARGDREKAVDELQRCVELYPAHVTAYYKLFRLYESLERPAEAQAALRQYSTWKRKARATQGER